MEAADGDPMPGIYGDRYRTPAVEPALDTQDLRWAPRAVGGAAAPDPAPLARTESGSGATRPADVAVQPADTPEPSTQMPYSPPPPIQSPSSLESSGRNRAAPQPRIMDSGCFDHLSYDQSRDL